MELLTGNQIGSLLGWYRIKTMFDLGWLTESNRSRAVLIKTLVTTDLQSSIAESYGISVIDTLTGFKYIGEKLKKYEDAIEKDASIKQARQEAAAKLTVDLVNEEDLMFNGFRKETIK